MNAKTKKQIKALNDMRLPDLQAKYREVVGEESRSPNRKFLIRKITERLTAADAAAAPAAEEGAAAPAEGAAAEGTADEGAAEEGAAEEGGAEVGGAAPAEGAAEEGAAEEGAAAPEEGAAEEGAAPEGAAEEGAPARRRAGRASGGKEKPLSQMTVPELRKLYGTVVGRATSSTNKAYLIWKIREARKGRVPVGPRTERAKAEPGDFKVLPFRLPTRTVERLDKAYERHGYKSRTDFLRAATRALLTHHGETEVAALFEPEEEETESTEQRPARRAPRVRAATPSRKTRKARTGRSRASGGRRSRARGR